METRPAAAHDLQHLVDLRIAFLKDIYDTITEKEISTMLAALPDYYRAHLGKDFFAFLAFDGDIPVSAVYLLIVERPPNLHFITGKTCIFLNVYTDPAYRKRGFASALLSRAIEKARSMNVSCIELEATDAGAPVYQKLGFQCKQSQCVAMEYQFHTNCKP